MGLWVWGQGDAKYSAPINVSLKMVLFYLNQQKIVSTLSDFIYVETSDGQTKEKNQACLSDTSNKEQELEDQLMGLGERWTVLCNWVEHRANLLEIVQEDINHFNHIKKDIVTWIDETEIVLKNMEQESSFNSDPNQDMSVNTPLIIGQMKELKVRHDYNYSTPITIAKFI